MAEWKSNRPTNERSSSARTGLTTTSTTTDVYTISTAPFYLASGDDVMTHVSQHSWDTEGVDVVGGDKPDTFQTWSQRRAASVVNTQIFKRTTLVLIMLCAILLCVRTQIQGTLIDKALDVLLWVFTLEVAMATVFYQDELAGWLAFDMLIIVGCWLSGDRSALVLRAFRLLRALRKASGIPALKWVVKAILRSLPRMAAVCGFLLPSSLLIFAVWLTNLYPEQFSRVDTSALALFQIMTGGTSWAEVLVDIDQSNAWVPLSFIVVVTQFIFASLIVAIMCHAVSSVNDSERIWKTPGANEIPSEGAELKKLEQKVDSLTQTVKTLLQGQAQVLEALSRSSSPAIQAADS